MLNRRLVWQGDAVQIVHVRGLPRSPRFPAGSAGHFEKVPRRKVERMVLHQIHSDEPEAEGAIVSAAQHAIAADSPSGGCVGEGHAAIPYHYIIPLYPETTDGAFVVYEVWEPDWVTPATHRHFDPASIHVGLCGSLRSRWAPKADPRASDPPSGQYVAMTELWRYAQQTWGLGPWDLLPAAELGLRMSPGDVFEGWVQHMRGAEPAWLDPARRCWDERRPSLEHEDDPRFRLWSGSTKTWAARHEVMRELGVSAPICDYMTSESIQGLRALQLQLKVEVTGVWDPETELAVRQAKGQIR